MVNFSWSIIVSPKDAKIFSVQSNHFYSESRRRANFWRKNFHNLWSIGRNSRCIFTKTYKLTWIRVQSGWALKIAIVTNEYEILNSCSHYLSKYCHFTQNCDFSIHKLNTVFQNSHFHWKSWVHWWKDLVGSSY